MTQIICDRCGKDMTEENQYGVSLYQKRHAASDPLDIKKENEEVRVIIEVTEEKELCTACAEEMALFFRKGHGEK